MTDDAGAIEIHQTLHGYRDGHELLASSISLPSPCRRVMLALSDLSGDGNPKGFEDYISGYPLDDAQLYAFGRTWYAAEMSRPGCVWTHTLLVGFSDLGRIANLAALRQHFRRPELGHVPSALSPIRHRDDLEAHNSPPEFGGASYEIVTRLYGQDLPVIVFGDSSAQFENLVLRVWSQQWEQLRRTFAFCTGAFEPRHVEKRPFDLQVVPSQRQRRMLRASDKFSIVTHDDIARSTSAAERVRDAMAQTSSAEYDEQGHVAIREGFPQFANDSQWRDIITQDFVHRNDVLHKFVDAYCGDTPPHRDAYRYLVQCWALIESLDAVGISLRDLTSAIARFFPEKSVAANLKTAVLGHPSIVRGAKEADLVHELLTIPQASAFDAQTLEVASRAERLFREGPRWRADSIAWLLTTHDLNETGHEWFNSVLANLTVDDLNGLFTEDRTLFARLLRDRPALAADERLWRQPRELQRTAARTLADIDAAAQQRAITAIVTANAAHLIPTLVQELGPSVIPQIVNGLDHCKRELLDMDEWQWGNQLRGHDDRLLLWLEQAEGPLPWTLAFVVALLGTYNRLLPDAGSLTFRRHLHPAAQGDSLQIDYAMYCLTIAFRNYDTNSGLLAVAAFPAAHEAAVHSGVSRRAWQWINPGLPRPGFRLFEYWDDGEKLRRALVDAFLRFRWNAPLLRQAITNRETEGWFVRYCESFDAGRELLRRSNLG